MATLRDDLLYIFLNTSCNWVQLCAFSSWKVLAIFFIFSIPSVPASVHCVPPFNRNRLLFILSYLFCIKNSIWKSKGSSAHISLAKNMLVAGLVFKKKGWGEDWAYRFPWYFVSWRKVSGCVLIFLEYLSISSIWLAVNVDTCVWVHENMFYNLKLCSILTKIISPEVVGVS